jgi:hypothetical protein
MAMSTVAMAFSVVLWFDAQDARDEQAAAICDSRNQERRVHRLNLNDQIDQTEGLPEQVFREFGITKQDALERLRDRKQKLHPLAC